MAVMTNIGYWTGVVEDRDDPEKLGRCKVRIFGYHTEDLSILPTEDLPWAIPIQPVTSAATSGVGTTPLGIVTGSWVVGFFMDGEHAQQPIILGTLAGKPKDNPQALKRKLQQDLKVNIKKDVNGNPIYDGFGAPIKVASTSTNYFDTFRPLSSTQVKRLITFAGNLFSNNNYSKEGSFGELGKYQFSLSNLMDLSFISYELSSEGLNASILNEPNRWLSADGITSKKEFLANKLVQDNAFKTLLKANYDAMISLGKITEEDSPSIVAGLLITAHIFGATYADSLDRKDLYGKTAKEYFVQTNEYFGGTDQDLKILYNESRSYLVEETDPNLTNANLMNQIAFTDPNKKYPKYEYLGYSDINKLAVGDTSHRYFKVKENQKILQVPVANSDKAWNEPETAFAGIYPYNQVMETEAGHVLEFDNTPNAERIHLFHKSGTYIEIDVNGTMVKKTMGDDYEIVDHNNYTYVKGSKSLTVGGKTKIYVIDDAVIEVDGDLSVTGHGDTVVQAAKSAAVSAKNVVISAKDSVNIASDGPVNIKGSSVNINASKNLSLKAGTDFAADAGQNASVKGKATLMLDAVVVKTKMGGLSVPNFNISTLDVPKVKTPTREDLSPLVRPLFSNEKSDGFGSDIAGLSADQIAALSLDTPTVLEQRAANVKSQFYPVVAGQKFARPTGNPEKVTVIDCTPLAGVKDFNIIKNSYKVSENYVLADFVSGNKCSPTKLTAVTNNVASRTGEQIPVLQVVCNIAQVAHNGLEKIRAKYPSVYLTSALRRPGCKGVENSDHLYGYAIDMQFNNLPYLEYFNIGNWIINNLPFRQVLLEYEIKDGKFSPWIHYSLKLNGQNNIDLAGMPAGVVHHITEKIQITDIPNYIPTADEMRKLKVLRSA